MNYQDLYNHAHTVAWNAAMRITPNTMTVRDGTTTYICPEGVCGFAWISFKGNTPFGRYMKSAGLARKDYPSGLCLWVSHFGQSMERKEVYAREFSRVLNENGIQAYPGSRMD